MFLQSLLLFLTLTLKRFSMKIGFFQLSPPVSMIYFVMLLCKVLITMLCYRIPLNLFSLHVAHLTLPGGCITLEPLIYNASIVMPFIC